jgi:5-methylcytosine-specific restriction endonuclease McrA
MCRKVCGAAARKKKAFLYISRKKCCWCKKPLSIEEATLEHLVPRCYGGTNELGNLTLACYECNNRRGNLISGKYATLVERSCDFPLLLNSVKILSNTQRDKLAKRYRGLWA